MTNAWAILSPTAERYIDNKLIIITDLTETISKHSQFLLEQIFTNPATTWIHYCTKARYEKIQCRKIKLKEKKKTRYLSIEFDRSYACVHVAWRNSLNNLFKKRFSIDEENRRKRVEGRQRYGFRVDDGESCFRGTGIRLIAGFLFCLVSFSKALVGLPSSRRYVDPWSRSPGRRSYDNYRFYHCSNSTIQWNINRCPTLVDRFSRKDLFIRCASNFLLPLFSFYDRSIRIVSNRFIETAFFCYTFVQEYLIF